MPDVISLGEILVEIMRKQKDVPHYVPGDYAGPYPSGAPAIFIDAVARLGVGCGFIGVVGDDDFGRLLKDRLSSDGVNVSHVKVKPGYTTGTTFVMYYSSGARKFIFHLRHAAAGQLSPDDVDPGYIAEARALHIMGSALAVSDSSREACYKAARIAEKHGLTLTFDPNLRPELLDVEAIRRICEPVLKISDVVLLSGGEAETLTGLKNPFDAGRRLLEAGPKIAVVKLGERGSIALTREEVVKGPAFDVMEVDPTGAGDVYDGAFVVGLLKGWPLKRTVEFANAAGAIKVMSFGPMEGILPLKEVEEFMARAPRRPWAEA